MSQSGVDEDEALSNGITLRLVQCEHRKNVAFDAVREVRRESTREDSFARVAVSSSAFFPLPSDFWTESPIETSLREQVQINERQVNDTLWSTLFYLICTKLIRK